MKMFYLKNYKSIHHLITLVIYFVLFLLMGMGNDLKSSFELQIFLLAASFFTTKFTLKASGLDEKVEKGMDKYKQKKSGN
jgi:hypothetical protein